MSTPQDEPRQSNDPWAHTQVQGTSAPQYGNQDNPPTRGLGDDFTMSQPTADGDQGGAADPWATAEPWNQGGGQPGAAHYGAPAYGVSNYGVSNYGVSNYEAAPYGAVPGYGAIAHTPSGGTAITAAALALLGAFAQLFVVGVLLLAIVGVSAFADEFGQGAGTVAAILALMLVPSLAILVALTRGGINLLRGKSSGRTVTAVASVAMILLQGIGLVISVGVPPGGGFVSIVFGVFLFLFPVATLVLVLLRQTSEWIAAKEAASLTPAFYPSTGYGAVGNYGHVPGGYGPGRRDTSDDVG